MDREYDPFHESVVEVGTIIILGAQAGFQEIFILETLCFGCISEGMLVRRRPAQTILFDGLVFKSPGVEI